MGRPNYSNSDGFNKKSLPFINKKEDEGEKTGKKQQIKVNNVYPLAVEEKLWVDEKKGKK